MKPLDIQARGIGKQAPTPVRLVTGRLANQRFIVSKGQIAFDKSELDSVDLSGQRIESIAATEASFVNCRFDRCVIERGSLGYGSQSTYRNCSFENSRLRNVLPGNARFENCSFHGARIDFWQTFLAEFVNCTFSGTLESVTFSGRPWGPGAEESGRNRNEFIGNDFTASEFLDCSFVRGIEIGRQKWPKSDAYVRLSRIAERIALVRAAVLGWKDLAARRDALIMLDVYAKTAEDQDELFARRDDLYRRSKRKVEGLNRDVCEGVWELLAAAKLG